MNLGWIRSLFTLSEIEKGRITEPAPDPRRIESFQDLDGLITQSLAPPASSSLAPDAAPLNSPIPGPAPAVTPDPTFNPHAKPMASGRPLSSRGLPDQDLLQKLLKHRPQYTSNRILRAETAAAAGISIDRGPGAADPKGNP